MRHFEGDLPHSSRQGQLYLARFGSISLLSILTGLELWEADEVLMEMFTSKGEINRGMQEGYPAMAKTTPKRLCH